MQTMLGDEQLTLSTWNAKEWLTPKELAGYFGLNEESAYRWRGELIPDQVEVRGEKGEVRIQRLIRYTGTARFLFHVTCIPFLEEKFSSAHD